jgi:hypothetical protein
MLRPDMANSRFEQQLDEALQQTVDAIFKVQPGNPEKDTFIKGQRSGLLIARSLYREANKLDTDPDDIA